MKKTIKLAVVAALALGATSAFATNGDHLIGLGAKARAMGGTGVAVGHGAESALANPAMLSSVKGSEVSVTATIFMPKVAGGMAMGTAEATAFSESAADMSVIPEISYATQINDNLTVGFGIWGTAGMGVDYKGAAAGMTQNMNMFTNLMLAQIGVPVAYSTNGISIGFTPILQYGALEINYDMSGTAVAPDASSDTGVGYNLGVSYTNSGVTLGAVYKSAIEMTYDGVLSGATGPFAMDQGAGMGSIFPGALSDTLEQPAEIGIGASYSTDGHTLAVDYKQIKWSEAKGYSDFKWDDQTVIALGYEYATKGWAVRLGYNSANNPIKDAGAMTTANAGAAAAANAMGTTDFMPYLGGNAVNTFNLLGFPATVESHMTLGGTYDIDDAMSLDVAYMIAPETSNTLLTMPNGMADMSTTVTHSQSSLSVQLNYAY